MVYNCANLSSLEVDDDAVWPGLKGFDHQPDIIFDHCSDDESDLSLTGSSAGTSLSSSSIIYCDDDVENTLKEVSLTFFLYIIVRLRNNCYCQRKNFFLNFINSLMENKFILLKENKLYR